MRNTPLCGSLLLFALFVLPAPYARAADKLVTVDTRPGVTVSFWYMKRPGAKATLMILPGGTGSIGMKDGVPTSGNFLVRTRDLFAGQGFNVALVGRPSDKDDLDFEFRVSPEHVEDLRKVTAYLKKESGLPLWMVGTSRGTVSATAAAIAFGNGELAGIVLTSSVTRKKTGALTKQNLGAIRIPVLVMHHERDACPVCDPDDVPSIMRDLSNAPVKKQMIVNGGSGAHGDPCEAFHWHGYIGMEDEAVRLITGWISNPKP